MNLKESRLAVIFDRADMISKSTEETKSSDQLTQTQRLLNLAIGVACLENLCTKKLKSLDWPESFYSSVLESAGSCMVSDRGGRHLAPSITELLRLTRTADKKLLAMIVASLTGDEGNKPWNLMRLEQFSSLLHYFAQNVYILQDDHPEWLEIVHAWSFNYLDLYVTEKKSNPDNSKLYSWEYSQLCRILWSFCVLFKPTEIQEHMNVLYQRLGQYLKQGEDNLVNLSQIAL